jgi:Glycosyltransferases involved in cell wall biogenesis
MKLSIITVVRNAEKTIENTILSIVNQTFDDYEYIIIDGASSDSTNNIIDRYKTRIHKHISEPDAGIYDAMNKGILLSEGEWIYFLGADDTLYCNNTLSNFFAQYDNNADVLYGNVIFKNSKKVFDGEFDYNKMCLSCPCHQAVFYKKELFKRFGLFNTKYKINADAEMHIRTFCTDDILWTFKDQIIAIFNDTGVSSVRIDFDMRNDAFEICYNNFLGKVDNKVLARACLSNFSKFCLHNKPKVVWPYFVSIIKNIGIVTWIKVFFIRIYEKLATL